MVVGLAITQEEFEKGKPARSLSDRILEFLLKNSDKAYLEDDITTEVMREDPVLQGMTIVGRQAVVIAALNNLIRDGQVAARIPNKMPYYMLAVALGTPSSPKQQSSANTQ